MNAIIISLQSLIITVRKNFFHSFATVGLLLIVIVTWSARGNIASFLEHNPTAAQEKDRFDQSIVADAQINDSLTDIRTKINADRVLIRQFHNSKADLTGFPFASVSTTYYVMAPGITLVDGSFNPFPLSTINEQLALMFQPNQSPKCAKVDPSAIKDATYSKYLSQNGVAVSYACPIMNLRGQPVGYIGAGYLTKEKSRPTDVEIEAILNNTGERVVGYLDGVIRKEKKPWYVAIFGNATTPLEEGK